MKKLCLFFLSFLVFCILSLPVYAEETIDVSAPSVLLMDQETGKILYAKDELTKRPLASVTKVMTLLLIFDALEQNSIQKSDIVTVSEHAASMGGSQVFLEPGETQTVDTMIKCIVVASANDACVAMAEHLAGTESAFVEQMNQKAADLGMEHTNFVNACGLDADNHYSCALDIAMMTRELALKHPQIFDYTKIWMEDITHHTKKGDSTFTLSSTNKFMKQYIYATGLKTGSTSKALFCLSATATKDDLPLIAAIMGAPDSKSRIKDACLLFDWGFGHCKRFSDPNTDQIHELPVQGGKTDSLELCYQKDFSYLDTSGSSEQLSKKIELPDYVTAPISKNDEIGKACYYLGESKIGEIPIVAKETIEVRTFKDDLLKILHLVFLGRQGAVPHNNRSTKTVPQL